MNKILSNKQFSLQDAGLSIKRLSPLKAIRAKCLDCMVYQPKEVRLCDAVDCSLHSFRFGKNPNRKGIRKNLLSK